MSRSHQHRRWFHPLLPLICVSAVVACAGEIVPNRSMAGESAGPEEHGPTRPTQDARSPSPQPDPLSSDATPPSEQVIPPPSDTTTISENPDARPSSKPDPVTDEALSSAVGCSGIFNPSQLLTFAIDLSPEDWTAVINDRTNSLYVTAQIRCGSDPPMVVAIRRKRSGGTVKVGLKVDINRLVDKQSFYGLKKLSLENGISDGSGSSSARALLGEYLGWRLMVLSGAHTSRAAFVKVVVNGRSLGVYVNVEQVDKRFLRARFGDDSGWLYKKSGSPGDGWKTNEMIPNPYDAYFCFWAGKTGSCPVPAKEKLLAELLPRLDIPQMIRIVRSMRSWPTPTPF
jgi:hypothetical protein